MNPSDSALLMRAAQDDSLSLKAKGLLLHLVVHHADGVPSAANLASALPEGRDAIQAYLRELINAGYLTRFRVPLPNKAYRTETYLSGANGKPLVLQEDRLSDNTSLVNNARHVTKELPSGVLRPLPSGRAVAEINFEGDSVSLGLLPEDVPDTPVRQSRGYITRRKRANTWDKRAQRPPEEWNTRELVAEFSDLTLLHIPNRTGQVNAAALGGTFNRWRNDGIPQADIYEGIRMFFESPQNYRTAGQGTPAWKAFIWYFQTNQVKIARSAGTARSEIEEDIQQDRDDFVVIGKRAY